MFTALTYLICAWFLGLALVVFCQRRLIFSPPKKARSLQPGPWLSTFDVVAESFCVGDNVLLEGWRSVLREGVEKRGIVLYFGGRSENVRWAPCMSSYLPGWEVIAFNYRGFGGSYGRATEKHVVADALAIYDTFQGVLHPDSAHKIAVMGRSLGSGVAVQLATKRLSDKLVLISPYSSLASVVIARWFLLPAAFFLRHKFESIKYAPSYDGDAMIFVTPNDAHVTPENSRRLAAAFSGNTAVEEIHGAHHKTLPRNVELQKRLGRFLVGPDLYST
jgi:alpha/beta superfamily hydrolase